MKLINTDGMAFIGPGSEWFWTAISGLILAVTFIAIYRQLRLHCNAAAVERVEALFRDWQSERISRSKLEVLLAIQAKAAPLDVPELAASDIADFMDRTAYLVRNGHTDKRLVHSVLSRQAQQWWARLLPSILALRERDDTPEEWRDFEWLARTMAEMDTKSGTPQPSDGAYLATHLDELIALIRRAVGIQEERRTVLVRLTPTPVPVMSVGLVHPDAPASARLEDRSRVSPA